MPRNLDTIIGFSTSTALVFNLGTYLLPASINRAFTSIIHIAPRCVDTPSLDFTMLGKCYADEVRISCLDAVLEVARAGSTGYDQVKSESYLRMMKPLIASYSIFHGLLLLSCYALLAYELSRTSVTKCPSCQSKITSGYKKFAAICMELTTVAGLAASAIGLWFALNLTSDHVVAKQIDSRIGSGWVLNLLATLGWFAATMWFSFDSTGRETMNKGEVECQAFDGLTDEGGREKGQIVLETGLSHV